ncbi:MULTISPECIES: LLM class flavin-dependent oxidoreductase [Methylosinus]|uniref:LLM class flavin-dependent oxidoreductase n=1 Tax=Methylosinus trichosporium (strain ATCC 35070 / NCIMB 11131 / UNIQEM 75 / OB3b) TaxID=595536 RepID=A0A2D2D3D8_METT3|nr:MULTISPECIES: LLM class flavin-dependent oxidoreductase [Methylosinus]ATQ69379.1 LLM class flavin-dependent oxidoreductase [Methylosinus trichosporium OB3b]OBS52893.1 luciferase [Methylosinus sp. 3S-1]
MNPRFGYLCLFDNPTLEDGRALTRQLILVREAERMRFDDIWVGEQHFDDRWPSGATSVMLGYAAGVTMRARVGSAAYLPALRDPIQLAEDVASIDLLTKGRFNFGVASGAAFGDDAKRFGVEPADLAERGLEALELVQRLLKETDVTHKGKFFDVDKLTLAPRPEQPIPTWIATTTDSTIRLAARKGYGLMASATCTEERLRQMLAIYREEAPEGDPRLVLARFGFATSGRDEAISIATPYLEAFCEQMKRRDRAGSGELDPQALLSMSLVGDYKEVAAHVNRLNEELGVHGIAVIPTSAQFDTVKRCLAAFVDEIRLRLPVD